MIYDTVLTIPAGTADTAPASVDINITGGIIHKLEVEFAPGCARMCKVRLWDGGHQVAPANPDGFFASDGYTISFDEFYEVKSAPYVIRVTGSAPDATYDHDVVVRIGILESRITMAFLGLLAGLGKMLKMVGIRV